jgi:hypothetical protein
MTTASPPQKKKISRRKPGEKSFRNYFDDETQEAIVRYQESVTTLPDNTVVHNYEARNNIYVMDILPAFATLVENLINVYGYHVLYESRDDLKNECLEFLYGTIDKWKKDRGTKAFSYFNVVAKHWLTVRSKQNVKVVQNYVSLDNREALSKHDLHLIEEQNVLPSAEDLLINDNISKNLPQLVETLKEKAKTDNERSCLDAIEILVKNIDDIDLLSKRAVMLYIREITGLSSKQLSIVLSSLKKQYRTVKEEMTK